MLILSAIYMYINFGTNELHLLFKPVHTSASNWIEPGLNLDKSHPHLLQVMKKWIRSRLKLDWAKLATKDGLKWMCSCLDLI